MNDGGLSWLQKNYQRMKEQAEREQRSLNDVVAERYGVRTRHNMHNLQMWVTGESCRTDECLCLVFN